MNICIFAKGLPVHAIGGMEVHVQGLVDGLIKRQHKITIITTRHPQGIEKEETENLKIYYVGDKSLKCTGRFYKDSAELFKTLNHKERFDIVHSQSTSGYGFAKFCIEKIPFTVTLHGTTLNEIKSALNTRSIKGFVMATYLFFKDIILNDVEKPACQRANKIIAVSNELKEDIKKQYKIPAEKIITIPNGVEVDKFKPNVDVLSLKEKYRLQNQKIILTTGAMIGQKGHHLLLQILPELLKENNNLKLILVGHGPKLNNLQNMTKRLNISENVIFAGKVSDEDLIRYYNLADIFAFPTLRMEGFPYVIPEAMACERPVIASRIGGIPTIIENRKDGILIQPGNLKELKDGILELLSDEKLAKRLGKNARKKIVERYSLDRMVVDTIQVYEKVLKHEHSIVLEE